jgi:uncharacterized membrane protein YfcA
MSELTPYETLQVSEDATFEEIQAARDRLIAVHQGQEVQREEIEAAYDAVLMDRLRQRQEGKIKVPERIRFAERLAEAVPSQPILTRIQASPAWLQRLLDRPSLKEIAIPGLVYAVLGGIGVYARTADALSVILALGIGFNLFWLNRKEHRLGRSFLITLVAMVVGAAIGAAILQLTPPLLGLAPQAFVSLVVIFIFWLASSFLR